MNETSQPVSVYVAGTPFEAHFVCGLLESQGIEAEVRGEALYSGRGEIPMTIDTLPSVWILHPTDFEAARRQIADYERGAPERGPRQSTWRCNQCGEAVEAQFSHCWNCGAEKLSPVISPE